MAAINVNQALRLVGVYQQNGQFAAAEAMCRSVLSAEPDQAEALHLLGLGVLSQGRHEEGRQWLVKAAGIAPARADFHCDLGVACRALGRTGEAVECFRKAVALDADSAAAWSNLSDCLLATRKTAEAIECARRGVEAGPGLAGTHNNLGNALRKGNRFAEAAAAYGQAVQLQPGYAEAHSNLGFVLTRLGRRDDALAACRRAVELQPHSGSMHDVLGEVLRTQGRLDEALAVFRRSLQLAPERAETHHGFGKTLADTGNLQGAIAEFRRALTLRPDDVDVHVSLGDALQTVRCLDEATSEFRRAIELQPENAAAHNGLGNASMDRLRLDEALAEFGEAIRLDPGALGFQDNLLLALHYHPQKTRAAVVEEHRRWNERVSAPLRRLAPAHANARVPGRRLRIGYVSADFSDHVVGRNVLPLFRRHDHRAFEIFCYSDFPGPDAMTAEFRQCADHWRSNVGLTDQMVAEAIRQDGIDVLVDLAQHTAGNRLPVFAHRPAPVQVSFAGYPEGTGLEAIEYRMSDRWLEGGLEDGPWKMGDLGERVFLIDSFWCYDPQGIDLAVNGLPARSTGRITFGCLNAFCKINAEVLALWARVLREADGSRLLLLTPEGSHRQLCRELLAAEGIEAQRVDFLEPCRRREYLALYHQLDVMLDTFPYNGHTTSLDALWMGVPVVSLAGLQPVSRAGLSHMANLGLRELTASSPEDYVRIAVGLVRDLDRLARLRSELRARMEASVLMDAPRFAENIETAYRAMWRQWCGADHV